MTFSKISENWNFVISGISVNSFATLNSSKPSESGVNPGLVICVIFSSKAACFH
ncbi:hypothetical protein N8809_02580 [Euryarchaeota archaeon]|nr:hypothetical protein [Euryarchaeota archaeon]